MVNELISQFIGTVLIAGSSLLMPFMVGSFLLGVLFRGLIYFTTKAEYTFSLEIEKRVYKHLSEPEEAGKVESFHQLAQFILEKTYYEVFELKHRFKRRRYDHVTSITDRLFLIQAGAGRLVRDTLNQTRYLKKNGRAPKFLDISKYVFSTNPVFTKVFGIFPLNIFHDTIAILPGLFVIGGIFGTFLGTMQALPELSNIDVADPVLTKQIMDTFLLKMVFAMGTSVLGICLSVVMTILNTIFSPEAMYINMVNKYAASMEFLWNDTLTNEWMLTDGANIDRRSGHVIDGHPQKPKKRRRKIGAAAFQGSTAKKTSQQTSQQTPQQAKPAQKPVDETPDGLRETLKELEKQEQKLTQELEAIAHGKISMPTVVYEKEYESLINKKRKIQQEIAAARNKLGEAA